MKIPTPKKKENGKWLVQVMVDGKRKGKEFDTKEEAIYWATGIKTAQIERGPDGKITVIQAIRNYIESKSAILSPSTILNYDYMTKNQFASIEYVNVSSITQEIVQKWANQLAKTRSPKTVRNAHGLLSAALKMYRPNLTLATTLPQKQPPIIDIPTQEELGKIMRGCIGTKIELPVMLAIWLGLRYSEIRGLTWDMIDKNGIYIGRAIVVGRDGPTVKGTKSYAGNRYIHAPKQILDIINKQPKTDDYIFHMSGQSLGRSFAALCRRVGVPHYRFHDLRHVSASAALALNIPDKYAMQRMGHATNNMLKNVYQHTFKEQEDIYADMMDRWFVEMMENNLQPNLQPNTKK